LSAFQILFLAKNDKNNAQKIAIQSNECKYKKKLVFWEVLGKCRGTGFRGIAQNASVQPLHNVRPHPGINPSSNSTTSILLLSQLHSTKKISYLK
jgi:hypothetical protein